MHAPKKLQRVTIPITVFIYPSNASRTRFLRQSYYSFVRRKSEKHSWSETLNNVACHNFLYIISHSFELSSIKDVHPRRHFIGLWLLCKNNIKTELFYVTKYCRLFFSKIWRWPERCLNEIQNSSYNYIYY